MDLRYGETVYVLPTTTTLSIPTAYVATSSVVPSSYLIPSALVVPSVPTAYVATSSVVPSSYLIPSALVVPSYYPTAYFADEVVLAPTTYVETRYRPGLLGRLFGRGRLVERSVIASYPAYVPTSFSWPAYYPTTYSVARDYTPTVLDSRVAFETAYVTSPASPCEEVVSSWRVPVREAPSVKVPVPSANRGSKPVESKATDETIPSDVGPPGEYTALPKPQPTEDKFKVKSTSPPATAKGSEAESPPLPPVPQKETNITPATSKPAGSTATKPEPKPPAAPTGEKDNPKLELAPGANNPSESRHDVQKPLYATTTIRPERRNVLFGKVESSAAGQPEEEVRVIVSSRSNRAIRHEGMTDAFGRFAIKLTEGDWTVNVTMPSGRIYPVSQITVTGGRILDEREGREVPSLIITR